MKQEHFKVQEEIWFQESRIKFQDSSFKNQDQDSRLKNQESREDLIKIGMEKFFQKLSSTWIFLKTFLPKSFYSLVIDYQIVVIDYQ